MPTELTDKRTARSKTFLLDDGVTHRLEAGGGHAHHQENGLWVPTDVNWTDLTDRFGVGAYPFAIGFVKSTRTLTIDFKNGDVLTLTPRNIRAPLSITRSGNSVTLVRLWTGITLELLLTPDGLHFHYIKTATTFVNPSYTVTGDVAKYHGSSSYLGTDGMPVTVPDSLVAGVLTYDFAGVPVGTVVE
jgi:hypothetical protein